MRTTTRNLAQAMRILANEIESDDGVANCAILEAASRLDEYADIEESLGSIE